MKRFATVFMLCVASSLAIWATPIDDLLNRIDKGASSKFVIEQVPSSTDFFELDQQGKKVVVRGNNYVNIATGINWYLKYYAHIHLSWNQMQAKLPDVLPAVAKPERHATKLTMRYDFNYCTYSYSMAFWDWKRWEKELDWMAMHGINMALAIVGTDVVWANVLKQYGYNEKEINEYVAGPAFQAWWLMNNLEGWGGPNPKSWYAHSLDLQKKIVKRMRQLGIEPIFPGYSGMVPHNAKEKLGLNVADPGLWCGYNRPAFLQPTDDRFAEMAKAYYDEMTRLYGKAKYYSMDPFHEGGNTEGVNLAAAGKSIHAAMKRANPEAAWVIQAWQDNPRRDMIKDLPQGDVIVLDLFAESRPQWGDPDSPWSRKNGFEQHDWIFCMLLNYGGNVGLHGKMAHLIDEFYKAKNSAFAKTMTGVGMTPEGIENNPVMFELLCELPWRDQKFSKDEWLKNYVIARYGTDNDDIYQAWLQLSNSIYNCPAKNDQQGTHESIFCARPRIDAYRVSSWSLMQDYYNPADVIAAAKRFAKAAEAMRGNNNYEYDLADIVRQALAEQGRIVFSRINNAIKAKDAEALRTETNKFMRLIATQDALLATRPEFRLGTWIEAARNLGKNDAEKNLYEWNACVQITTWGNRRAADKGGLRDYAHREWSGLLNSFYASRWAVWLGNQYDALVSGKEPAEIDFYQLEEAWVNNHEKFTSQPEGTTIEAAKMAFKVIAEVK